MKQIPLSKDKIALIDDDDFERINQYKWHAHKGHSTHYARMRVRLRDGNRKNISMHRFIMNHPLGLSVDHIDGNGLNNTRSNLIIATASQNMANSRPKKTGSSRYKGVFWNTLKNRWTSAIRVSGKLIFLGHFNKEEQAAEAYDNAAREYFREFARLNFK